MKKSVLAIVVIIPLVFVGGYYLYQTLLPELAARAFISQALPDYIPKRIQSRMHVISEPVSEGTEAMVHEMHASGIGIEKLIAVIDQTTEEQAYGLLDDLNNRKSKTPDQVFDVIVKHIAADFNVEVFRKPFNDHVTMKSVRKALYYANQNRKTHDLNFVTAKAIIKKILLEKEKEYKEKRNK